MQMAHHPRHIIFFHDEADVNFRRALGNHADVDLRIGNRIENAGRDARLAVNVLTDEADHRLIIIDIDVGNLLEVFD